MPDEPNGISLPAKELEQLLEAHGGERHLIVLQDYPDPDAIASALAHQMISARRGIDTQVVYGGAISHQENIAMVRLLELDVVRYGPEVALDEFQHCIFVDNQGTTTTLTGVLEEAGLEPLVIVDHHEKQPGTRAEFMDIRKVGSTSTIYTEYLAHGLLPLDRSESSYVRLTTCLMFGLRTDTAGLVRARPEDFEAAAFLSRYYDATMLQEILGTKRSKRVMEGIQTALHNRYQYNNHTISGVGYLTQKDRDIIPQVADFLMTEENVHTVVVYGVIQQGDGSESVVGSMRTNKMTISPDQFLKEAFGADERGTYYGGGRRGAGGFEIPVGFISGSFDEEYDDLKWRLIDRNIRQKILGKLGQP